MKGWLAVLPAWAGVVLLAWVLAPYLQVIVVLFVVLAVVGGMAAVLVRRTTATAGTTVREWEEHRAALYAGQEQSEIEGRPIQVIRGEIEG